MTIEIRKADGMMRQFCRWCENEYGHEFDPHGEWLIPTSENYEAIKQAEREHDQKHTPAVLKPGQEDQ